MADEGLEKLPVDDGPSGEGLPYALIGAGPAGLGAARCLSKRGIDFVGFEAGDEFATGFEGAFEGGE